MTDSSGREGSDPTQPLGGSYSGYTDPAYASQAYGPTYAPAGANPTEQLPGYPPNRYNPYSGPNPDPYATTPYGYPYGGNPPQQAPPPEDPRSPRWLWILATLVVLVVVGLVVALVIANSSRQETVRAPWPSMTDPTFTTPSRAPTTSRRPTPALPPLPTSPRTTSPTPSPSAPPTTSAAPTATESVVYEVAGSGRAINITYVDSGGVLQTEFNVLLPWRKEVELSSPAESSASVSVINVGRNVTCSVSVDGQQILQRTGSGLTICVATG